MTKTYLKDLEEGETFYPASKEGKATPIFKVKDQTTGIPLGLTLCENLSTNEIVRKRKYLQVIKHTIKEWKRDW